MNHNEISGRHRRRRSNSFTRAALDEARRAGLVQRHLTKLRLLTTRSGTAPSTPAGTGAVDGTQPSNSEAA
ncbi:hypothetical protein [Amycolatopsis balhimycina]|uniref:hypothetical protein n=1 Tax=Amycolatopsis balhimycina TaxID=208443 RepID=UPI00039A01D8|nr:hypothetical protein [Amycolatopsis balhimycina]